MAKPKDKESVIQDITNRFRVTAREARDIVTAIGNVGAVIKDESKTGASGGVKKQIGSSIKEIKKQAGETVKAATTGKKGTPSKQYMTPAGDSPSYLMTPRGTTKNNKRK
jgi:hypothetical protein